MRVRVGVFQISQQTKRELGPTLILFVVQTSSETPVRLEVPGGSRDCLTNNNEEVGEAGEGGELSSECSHHNGCIRLRSRILPKLRLGRR